MPPVKHDEIQYASFIFFEYYELLTKALSAAVKKNVFGKYNPLDYHETVEVEEAEDE